MSNRSRGPSVNDILAQSAMSITKNRLASRSRLGAPQRSVSRGFTGAIAAKKFDEQDLPEMGAHRRAQQPSQNQKNKGNTSITKTAKKSK